MTEGSRFTPPWTIEETQACFFVKDFRGQKLAYTYFGASTGDGPTKLTRDEARRRAASSQRVYHKRAAAERSHLRYRGQSGNVTIGSLLPTR